MLYYGAAVVKHENRSIEPPGQEAAHALDSLVASGVRFAVRLRPDPNLPVDGALSGGNGYPQGTAGGHQHRTCPGIGARLLRPAPGLLPQSGFGSAPNSPVPGVPWSSAPTLASYASMAGPSSLATASRSPRPDARCPESRNSINNPSQTPSRSISLATSVRLTALAQLASPFGT